MLFERVIAGGSRQRGGLRGAREHRGRRSGDRRRRLCARRAMTAPVSASRSRIRIAKNRWAESCCRRWYAMRNASCVPRLTGRDALVQPADADARHVDGLFGRARRRAIATCAASCCRSSEPLINLREVECPIPSAAPLCKVVRAQSSRSARAGACSSSSRTCRARSIGACGRKPARLSAAGYVVSIICPKAPGYEKSFERIDGIDIHRHRLPAEADGVLGYALEYSVALAMEFWLSLKILFGRGFDVIHACNPPDTIFLIGAFYKLFGKKYVFDHHDINPELYEAKFGKRGFGRKPARGARAHELQHGGHGDLDQRVVSLHRHRARPQESEGRVRGALGPGSVAHEGGAGRIPRSSTAASISWATSASWASRKASTCCCRPCSSSFIT